jgi:glycosyltransferase involved in cell wall biosynthesis
MTAAGIGARFGGAARSHRDRSQGFDGDRALTVALVGPGFPPQLGGVEQVLERHARELAGRGVRVEVLVQRPRRDRRAPAVEQWSPGVVVRRFDSVVASHRFPIAPGLVAYLRTHRDRFDVVHGHSFHCVAAVAAALATDRPFVCTPHFHGTGHTPLARLAHVPFRFAAQRALDRAAGVVCVSAVERELLTSTFSLPPDKAVVLPNGVDRAVLLDAQPFEVDRPVVLVVGRLEPYKRVERAIEAVARLGGRVRLVVVGDGPDRRRLERVAATGAASGTVTFTGQVDESTLRRWQRTASVVLTLSGREAFGLVVLEGLAAGAAVVASDIPAHREVARRWGPGVHLVPSDVDPPALAALVESLADHPRSEAGGRELPTWEEQVDGCLALYRQAVAHDRRTEVRP